MFITVSICIIIVVTIVAIVRSKKPFSLIVAEARYEIIYNALGSRALMQDLFMRSSNKTEIIKKTGKYALITGGARGIGLEVVKMLLKCDIHVIIGCRNVQVTEVILKQLREKDIQTGNITAHPLDISSIDSVKKFAKIIRDTYPKIHYLINNAGIMFGPRMETRDGYESQFSTNYLGHFLLTHLLLPKIRNSGEEKSYSRIVNVSSCAHEVGTVNFDDLNFTGRYIPSEAYAQSKLAQILFTNHLDRLFKKEGLYIQAHSVHPGIVNTGLFDGTNLKIFAPWLPALIFKKPEEGAMPIVHACISPNLEKKGGTYIHNCKIFDTSEIAKSIEVQEKLFKLTLTLLAIDEFGVIEEKY